MNNFKLFQRLLEARKNPTHPHQRKQMDTDVLDKYRTLPKSELDTLYVSFTELDKIGINPQTRNTRNPVGVYAYRLSRILDSEKLSSSVPYAGNGRFVWVLKARNPPLVLQHYSVDQCKSDLNKLGQMSDELNTRLDATPMDGVRLATILWDAAMGKAGNNVVKLNGILRGLGYNSVEDLDGSILGRGGMAKDQIVFLSSSAYRIVDKVVNTSVDSDGSLQMSQKMRQFIRSGAKEIDHSVELVDDDRHMTSYKVFYKHMGDGEFEYYAFSGHNYSGKDEIHRTFSFSNNGADEIQQAITFDMYRTKDAYNYDSHEELIRHREATLNTARDAVDKLSTDFSDVLNEKIDKVIAHVNRYPNVNKHALWSNCINDFESLVHSWLQEMEHEYSGNYNYDDAVDIYMKEYFPKEISKYYSALSKIGINKRDGSIWPVVS